MDCMVVPDHPCRNDGSLQKEIGNRLCQRIVCHSLPAHDDESKQTGSIITHVCSRFVDSVCLCDLAYSEKFLAICGLLDSLHDAGRVSRLEFCSRDDSAAI